MKKTLLTGLLACSCLPAFASHFYVVVPLPAGTPTETNISVALSGYTLPSGVVGRAYSGFDFNSVLQVQGDPSYSPSNVAWSVAGGELPAGLSLGPDGTLSGTPTAAASSNVQVQASYKSKAGVQTYQLVIAKVAISLAGGTMPAGTQNQGYQVDVKSYLSESGDPAYTSAQVSWSLIGGALPGGLVLNADGTISGTPNNYGSYVFQLLASYLGQRAQASYSLSVNPAGFPDGQVIATNGSSSFYGWGADSAPVVVKQFSFTNTGPVAATGLYAFASTNAPSNGASFSVVSSNCGTPAAPVTLPAGATCTFVAKFNGGSNQGGSGTGSVGVTWGGPNIDSRSMAVSGLTEYD